MRTRASNGCRLGRFATAIVLLSAMGASSAARAVDLIGYLPYYRMNASYNANTLPDQLPLLDEIRYFGLTINSSGAITPLGGSGSLATHLSRIDVIRQAIDALPQDQRPRLNITLGGAGEAAAFATVSASSTLRATLAQNIHALLDQSGASSVDTDWEHPDNNAELNNYAIMLQRIKQEVGPDQRVYATVDPIKFVPQSVFSGENAIDGISLMTYELAWWANDPADPNRGEHSLPEYADDSVEAWTDPLGSPNQRPWVFPSWGKNADPANLGIGLPFFGRVIGTSQQPQGGTAYTYAELANGGSTSDGNYYSYAGQTVWIPGPELAEQRVQFAHDRGLQNIIIWEIGQDLHPDDPNSLLRRAFDMNQSYIPLPVPGDYDGNGSVGPEDYDLWKSTFGALSGDMRADGNEDGVVNAADYTFWRNRTSAGAGNGSAANTAVPEPAMAILAFLLCAIGLACRCR
jgi:Glycosyl hydrolases family 18